MASVVVVSSTTLTTGASLSKNTQLMLICIYMCMCVCVNFAFLPLCVCVYVDAERNSRERERGSTLAVPEQQRTVQHRSRSVSPHREDSCRARSRPAHVPMQRSASPSNVVALLQCVVCGDNIPYKLHTINKWLLLMISVLFTGSLTSYKSAYHQ